MALKIHCHSIDWATLFIFQFASLDRRPIASDAEFFPEVVGHACGKDHRAGGEHSHGLPTFGFASWTASPDPRFRGCRGHLRHSRQFGRLPADADHNPSGVLGVWRPRVAVGVIAINLRFLNRNPKRRPDGDLPGVGRDAHPIFREHQIASGHALVVTGTGYNHDAALPAEPRRHALPWCLLRLSTKMKAVAELLRPSFWRPHYQISNLCNESALEVLWSNSAAMPLRPI